VARALVLIGTDGTNQAELRWRLLRSRVGALSIMGRWAEQRADVDALEALAEVLDDDRRRADAAIRRGEVAVRTDDYRTLESAARRGMMLAARAGDQVLRLRAQYQLVSALRLLGDTAAGKALAQDGLSAARAIGHLYSEAILLNQLSLFAQGEGDVVGDLEFGQKYLRIVQELGRQRDEAIGLTNLGHAWFRLGDDSQSRRYFEEGLRAHRAIRDRTMEGLAIVGLCGLALRQGDDALALAHAQAALDIAIDVQGRRVEVWALLYLGDAELALGRHAEAQAAFERSHAVAARIGNTVAYFAKAGLARVALARGDAARAMREIAGLLPHLDRDGILLGKGNAQLIQFTCHKVLARAGDPRAAAMLASAHTTLQTVAATIADPNLRRGYLTNIPTHRDIAAAWVAQQSSADE
jgi:tetratricopeptide (TPR) repeat protein